MTGSFARIKTVLDGGKPDRIPLFDLLPNDSVLAHFSGSPVKPGDDEAGCHAMAAALDGTRISYFSPKVPRVEALPDGRTVRYEPWTVWTEEKKYASSEDYAAAMRSWMKEDRLPDDPVEDAEDYAQELERRKWLGGDDFYYLTGSHFAPMMGLYLAVGLEQFGYFFHDCEDVILKQMDRALEYGLKWLAGLPADCPFPCLFLGDDFAFKTGPMVNPRWMRKHYFPKLATYVAAAHARGLKVMFHSDGNLMTVIDDLAGAGIDLLNPVEVSAGMDIRAIHRRYPDLVFAGGIDVTSLLPYGTEAQVRDAVKKAIEDSEGRILVGSSTEVFACVPLRNFLAMREAVFGYRL